MHLSIKLNKNSLSNVATVLLDHLKLIGIVVTVGIILGMGYFLYVHFYQTVIAAKQISILQAEVAPQIIDTQGLTQALELLDKKIKHPDPNWSEIRSVFENNIASTPTNQPTTELEPDASKTIELDTTISPRF